MATPPFKVQNTNVTLSSFGVVAITIPAQNIAGTNVDISSGYTAALYNIPQSGANPDFPPTALSDVTYTYAVGLLTCTFSAAAVAQLQALRCNGTLVLSNDSGTTSAILANVNLAVAAGG